MGRGIRTCRQEATMTTHHATSAIPIQSSAASGGPIRSDPTQEKEKGKLKM